jgi:cytoskeletal protein CcmA (bactofilin family)
MTPRISLHTICVLAAALLAGSTSAAQQVGRTVVKRGTIAEDVYLGGGTVDLRADVTGDVVAAGGRVIIEQRVSGDVMAAGGMVDISADVLDDVRAAGGTVALRGAVTGDAVAAGGTVELGGGATVGGRAWLGGGEVAVAGRVGRRLKARAERIVISGTVEGSVDLSAEEIEILPTARIAGTLTYRSPREARIDPAAQIAGGITRAPLERPSRLGQVARRLIVIGALGVLGAALIVTFPAFAAGAARTLGDEPWKSLGLGAATLVGGPIAAGAFMVTVVGFALGMTTLVVWGVALVTGYLTGSLFVGQLVVSSLQRGAPPTSVGAWIGALVIGVLGVALLRLIPIAGGVLGLAVLLTGMGALALHTYRAWRSWRARGQAVGAEA